MAEFADPIEGVQSAGQADLYGEQMRFASRPALVAASAATVLFSLPSAVQAHAGSGGAAQSYSPGFQVDLSAGEASGRVSTRRRGRDCSCVNWVR